MRRLGRRLTEVRIVGADGNSLPSDAHVLAVDEARRLIIDGTVGEITHCRVRLFNDYAAHPDGALNWRYERHRGGNGVLGDLASHGVDLVRFVFVEIESLVVDTTTFIPQRAKPTGATSGHTLTRAVSSARSSTTTRCPRCSTVVDGRSEVGPGPGAPLRCAVVTNPPTLHRG